MDESAAEIAELWRRVQGAQHRRSAGAADPPLLAAREVRRGPCRGRVCPQNIEQSDLVSYGIFGLIDAIDKFDPGRGYKFETYAISRIKGAIIDELRSIDWVPRSVRAKARSIERAYSKLENELRRSPEDGEVAEELGMTEAELATVLGQISFVGVVALDELLTRRLGTRERCDGRRHDRRRRPRPGRGVRVRRDAPGPRRRDQPHARS